jgi:hypothetical protein
MAQDKTDATSEPRDVDRPDRDSGRAASAAGRPGRPPKWNDASIREALEAVLDDWPGQDFPTVRAFVEMGHRALVGAMGTHGGLTCWAEELGYGLSPGSDRSPYGWKEARNEVVEVIDDWGALPGGERLAEAGYQRLASFLYNVAGNREKLLQELGYDERAIARLTDSRRARRRRVWTDERIECEARALLGRRRDWPGERFFRENGARGLADAVRAHGGREYWAERLGYALHDGA